MPERYDRSLRANELLLLRNAIDQRVAFGWPLAPAYHIPNTIDGNVRIGKDTGMGPPFDVVVVADLAQAVNTPGADTTMATAVLPSVGEVAVSGHNERSDQEVADGAPLQADELEGIYGLTSRKHRLPETTEMKVMELGPHRWGIPIFHRYAF